MTQSTSNTMAKENIQSPWMRLPEVCSYLNCSKAFVYNLNRDGLLRRYKVGERFAYWVREEVENFAKRRGA